MPQEQPSGEVTRRDAEARPEPTNASAELSDDELGAVAGGTGTVTTVTNVVKTEHDTVMSVIRNIP
jgi:hypothetical protein